MTSQEEGWRLMLLSVQKPNGQMPTSKILPPSVAVLWLSALTALSGAGISAGMQHIHPHGVTHSLEPDNLCLFPSASLPGHHRPPKSLRYPSQVIHKQKPPQVCETTLETPFLLHLCQIHSDCSSEHFLTHHFHSERLLTLSSHPFPLCVTGHLLPKTFLPCWPLHSEGTPWKTIPEPPLLFPVPFFNSSVATKSLSTSKSLLADVSLWFPCAARTASISWFMLQPVPSLGQTPSFTLGFWGMDNAPVCSGTKSSPHR